MLDRLPDLISSFRFETWTDNFYRFCNEERNGPPLLELELESSWQICFYLIFSHSWPLSSKYLIKVDVPLLLLSSFLYWLLSHKRITKLARNDLFTISIFFTESIVSVKLDLQYPLFTVSIKLEIFLNRHNRNILKMTLLLKW